MKGEGAGRRLERENTRKAGPEGEQMTGSKLEKGKRREREKKNMKTKNKSKRKVSEVEK